MVEKKNKPEERPWLGIRWACCNVYGRVYRDPDVMMYLAHCPKCLRRLKIRVDPRSGTTSKFFVAH